MELKKEQRWRFCDPVGLMGSVKSGKQLGNRSCSWRILLRLLV